jgi:hypothetical protein
MDIESLKLILEAVQGVSGSAMTLAIIWMFKGYFVATISWGAVIWLVKILVGCVITTAQDTNMKTIRDMLGVGSGGRLTDSEIRSINQKIAELIKLQGEQHD